MRVLVDLNVVLDVLLERRPQYAASAATWSAVERGVIEGVLPAHAVTTLYYLIRQNSGNASARRIVSTILGVFQIAPVDGSIILEATRLPCNDFEDAVAAAAGRAAGCEMIITRDPKGFHGSPIRVMTPEAAAPIYPRIP